MRESEGRKPEGEVKAKGLLASLWAGSLLSGRAHGRPLQVPP
jgi:hypothetical protein